MDLITPSIGLIFWTSIVFLTLLVLLGKFAWKPIVKALRDRENTISEALNAAEEAKEQMKELTATNEKLLAEARAEKDALLKESQIVAAKIVDEAKGKASKEARLIIEKAQAAIQQEKKAAIADIKLKAAELSINIAEKILKAELKDRATGEKLVADYIKEADLTVL